jgi:hypothetical protein
LLDKTRQPLCNTTTLSSSLTASRTLSTLTEPA